MTICASWWPHTTPASSPAAWSCRVWGPRAQRYHAPDATRYGRLPPAPRRIRAPQEWEELLALSVLSCAGMTTFLKDCHDQYFVDTYRQLLESHYPSAADADVPWPEAEEALRRHIATGGLDIKVRRKLFDEHISGLRQRGAD